MTRVLAGIDVPSTTISGSMALARNLYVPAGGRVASRFVSLGPSRSESEGDWWWTLPLVKHSAGYQAALTAEMERLLDAWQPQVIHLNHLTYCMTCALVEANRPRGVPTIAICHGTDLLEARADAGHRADAIRTLERATVTLFPTSAMASEAAALSPRAAERFRVVPWGIPRVPVAPPRDPEGADVLYAGRLDRNKDVATIVSALGDPGFDGGLTIVGTGPERERLELLAARLGVLDRVTFTPFVERSRLWDMFGRFWALVVSSREIEGFGLVAVEAQAAGLPVVYSATPGISEVLGDSALAFEPGSPASLAAAVSRLRLDPSLRAALREAGRANSARFDMRRFRASVEGLAAELSNSPGLAAAGRR